MPLGAPASRRWRPRRRPDQLIQQSDRRRGGVTATCAARQGMAQIGFPQVGAPEGTLDFGMGKNFHARVAVAA